MHKKNEIDLNQRGDSMKSWLKELFLVKEAWLGFMQGGLVAFLSTIQAGWPTTPQEWSMLVVMFLLAAIRPDSVSRVRNGNDTPPTP
jgi:hypothetical protein